MKILIVLALLLFVFALVALRYRKQIQTALYMWRMFKQMRRMSQPPATEKRIEPQTNKTEVSLVRCLSCGNWIAETNALKLGAKAVYCSPNCMEKAVKISG
jgi:hypothetical protein